MITKKRIINIVALAVIFVAAFLIGRNTVKPITKEVIPENYISAETIRNEYVAWAKIVDWNTDGKELAIFTDDGYEFYAQKTEDIYAENMQYIPFNKITGWTESAQGLQITLEDGTSYLLEK